VRITRELAELNPLIDAVKAYRAANAELAGIDALITDPATEPEMRGMAEAERETLQARSFELAQQIRVALLPKDAMDERNVVLEIRAGTGGDEAALSPATCSGCMNASRASGLEGRGDLSQRRHHGRFKEIIAEVQGRGAFRQTENSIRVHRVAARARHRDAGPDSHFGGDGCRAAEVEEVDVASER